jgi:hypothetical protein
MDAAQHPAWRLSLLWHDAVLDTVTVTGQEAQAFTLRTGEVFVVHVVDDALHIKGDHVHAIVKAGQRLALPAGHEFVVMPEPRPAPAQRSPFAVDSTLLHSAMIAFATTICVVSALWLHPVGLPGEPGAGVPGEARRWLALPGGRAPVVGRATFSMSGRPIDLGERFTLAARTSGMPAQAHGPRPSLETTLAAMQDALHGGQASNRGDAVGELSRQVASAPVLGAGVGGLSPRDPVESGAGNGVIGAGESLKKNLLVVRAAADREPAQPLPTRTTYPVTLVDVPSAAVSDDGGLAAAPELDPVVREHLTRMIRTRHNVVRACYEAWGLAADAHRAGRLVLELTLRPDGRVEALSTITSTPSLDRVGSCIERAAAEWYLGDGLVDAPTRLAFPFNLQPRQ